MKTRVCVPAGLGHRPFTAAMALAAGLTAEQLRGPRMRRLFRGAYICADAEMTLLLWIRAAALVLPSDAAASHATALWVLGVRIGSWWPLQFSTNTDTRSKRDGIVLHRRRGRIHPNRYTDVGELGADRTFVDCATQLSLLQLVQAGDWLIHLGRTTKEALVDYAYRVHIDGVRRARLVLPYVCDGVESPMETLIRLMLVFARLPKPECNGEIVDELGRFVARCDMVYAAYSVIVEYDGIWHEREPRQRQRDRQRLEELARLGWTVIVVTSEDLKRKRSVVYRVHGALVAGGYAGGDPMFNIMWEKWFA